jgi:hypothetical protein
MLAELFLPLFAAHTTCWARPHLAPVPVPPITLPMTGSSTVKLTPLRRMANEFTGRGWRRSRPTRRGLLLRRPAEHRAVAQGAPPHRPRRARDAAAVQTEAPRLVFAPGSEQYLRLLEQSVEDAVKEFEPRVDLLEVRAEPELPEPGVSPESGSAGREEARVTVAIAYRVRRSNTAFNLVFPFYLGTVETT